MTAPLIFFHSGFDPYLAFTVWQARRTNPGAPVWLIGDDTNDLSALGVRHFHYARHAGRRDEFVRLYRNISTHGPGFERLCIERWFYLEAILEQTGVNQFFYLDSDVLVLRELQPFVAQWSGHEIAGAPPWSFAWYARSGIIREFCDFVLTCYSDEAKLAEWERRFRSGDDFSPPEHIHNVCDMALWRMFFRERNLEPVDLAAPHNGMAFDPGLTEPWGFRMRGQFKELTRRSGTCFGFHEASAAPVELIVLHLNGKYPKRLPPLFTGWPWPVVRVCLRPPRLRNLRKLWLMASFSWRIRSSFFADHRQL